MGAARRKKRVILAIVLVVIVTTPVLAQEEANPYGGPNMGWVALGCGIAGGLAIEIGALNLVPVGYGRVDLDSLSPGHHLTHPNR